MGEREREKRKENEKEWTEAANNVQWIRVQLYSNLIHENFMRELVETPVNKKMASSFLRM